MELFVGFEILVQEIRGIFFNSGNVKTRGIDVYFMHIITII